MDDNSVLMGKQNKQLHFEIMRIIAIFFVIFIHTDSDGYYLFKQYQYTDISFWGYLCVTLISRFPVPLFFAISGALMLNRSDEPLGRLWGKRIFRYAILLVLTCFLYYVQAQGFDLSEINIKEFIIILYSYSSGGITWFLYSYLAYLILLPILATLAKNLKNSHYIYLFTVVLVYSGIVPVLEYCVFQGNQTINPYFTVGWIAEYTVVYPLLGYFLEYRLERHHYKKVLSILCPLSILAIGISAVMTFYEGSIQDGRYSSTFFSNFDLLNTCTVYLIASFVSQKMVFPGWSRHLICALGQNTLGIYMLHQFVMWLPAAERMYDGIERTGMDPMLASLLFCMLVMLICYGITVFLRKIPGVNKLL